MAAGADLAAPDTYGDTPLHRAVQYNENPVVIIEALVAAGGDAAARSGDGRRSTPLHRVAYRSGDENAVVQVLLNSGASLDARDANSNTPLHIAANYWGNWSFRHAGRAIKALLAAHADPTALNAAGETPWDLAQENLLLKGTDAYRRLDDARLSAPRRD